MITLLFLEVKKVVRSARILMLPVLFYLLACIIMISLVSLTPITSAFLRIFLWILVSLSLKLSFGTFLHDEAERNLIKILMAQGYPIGPLLLLKILISTLIFSSLFMGIFLGLVSLQLLYIQDILIVPVFVGSLFVLQANIELLTLRAKTARYLSYLLLLPLEIPILILVISQASLGSLQLLKTMGGVLVLSVGVLLSLCAFVFQKNKIA